MLASFNAETLFTNVPLKKTIDVILDRVYNRKLITTNLKKRTLTASPAPPYCFEDATIDEIKTILQSTEFKSSTVDPLPAFLLKENLEFLLPTICELVNLSLRTGDMNGAKLAHITPLLKGANLDPSDLKNYRPISNLSFVGKLIERVVLSRLN